MTYSNLLIKKQITFWRFKFYLWFCDDFRKIRNLLIRLNSLNIRREIRRQTHVKFYKILPGNCFPFPACNYIIKVTNRNTRTRCEICSKLTIKTPKQRHWRRSTVFIDNSERILHLSLVFLLLTLSKYWLGFQI